MTSSLAAINNYEYIESLFDELDVRPETLKDYKARLRHFVSFLRHYGSFDRKVLVVYKRMLADTNYSVSTKNKYLVAAKLFTRLLYANGFIPQDISQSVKSFQQSKLHKKAGLTENEVLRVIGWLNDNPHKLRERALLCLLLFQGLRQAEACNIRLSDVDLASGQLFILGKGRDDKEPVVLHEQTRRALKLYIAFMNCEGDEYLFTSRSCKSKYGKLTTRGMCLIIEAIFDELDIQCSVHCLRHYYTTRLVKSLPNLLEVAQLTRHKSLEMLQVYNDELHDDEKSDRLHMAFSEVSGLIAV